MTTRAGTHNDNIVLGAGELYVDLLSAGASTGERYVGDAVGASISVQTERQSVFSGTGAIAQELVNAITRITRSMTLTLHDITMENLALFVGGTVADVAANSTAVTDEDIDGVKQGRWYQLGKTKANPRGIGSISSTGTNTVVKEADGAPTYVATTDYIVDTARGRIGIVVGGGITDDTDLHVNYTPTQVARKRVSAYTLPTETLVAIRYLELSKSGKGRDVYAGKCSLGAAGEMALMSRTQEQQIQLTAAIQVDGATPPLIIDGAA